MKLQALSDNELHQETLKLVQKERMTSARILHHLMENDRRKLFSDFRCSSLFDYCVRILKYSDAGAQRRIVAARLLAEIPSLEEKIESGCLTLTNISQVIQYFREMGIKKTQEKKKILHLVENLTKKECEKLLFKLSGKTIPARESKKRISHESFQITLIVSEDTLLEFEKLKDLMGGNLSHDEVLKFMAKAGIEKIEKTKFKQTQPRESLPLAKVDRTPNAEIKRKVYQRDQCCVQCGSLSNLNYDHIHPWALGGETSEENIRLLCFHCNQRASIKTFGVDKARPFSSG